MPIAARSLVCLVAAAAALAAQAPPTAPPKTQLEIDKQVAVALVGWARMAESLKQPSRARAVYRQILDHYDADHPAARAGLGYKRVKGEWQQAATAGELPGDAPTPAQRKQLDDAWSLAGKRIAKLHADLGHTLLANGDEARGRHQLERALVFAPDDAAVHRALGHEELDGFFGTTAQIELVKRMRAIHAKAAEIAAMDVAVEPVDAGSLPRELRDVGAAFAGARSKHVTYWVAGEAAHAEQCARWHERGLALLDHLLGGDAEVREHFLPRPVLWVAVLRNEAQQRRLLETCEAARGGETLDRALSVGGTSFALGGSRAEWVLHHALEHDDDRAVGLVTNRTTPWFNAPLAEGLVHTMTWLLCGTLESSYMQLAPTVASDGKSVARSPEQWLAHLRDEIDAGTDWALAQLPRERLENFRQSARIKSWTFVTWLLARHPDAWAKLLLELGNERMTPEEVAAVFAKVLGEPIGDVDAQWREWARRGSRVGKASRLPH